MMRVYQAAWQWQSRAVLGRHLLVHVRNWYTAAVPPILEPVILLLAFGLGLGNHIEQLPWRGGTVAYLTYLIPGMMAYTAFMTAFFQGIIGAFVRMHFQKTWEGQLTTQVRLEHVIWGEAYWAAAMGTVYSLSVVAVAAVFAAIGWLSIEWTWLWLSVPVLFLSAVAFAAVGLMFTAIIPSIDHANLPFFLLIMPLAFTSSTFFPVESEHWLMELWLQVNALHHTAEGLRVLMVSGQPNTHLLWAAGLFGVMIAILVPLDLRLLRRRVLGERGGVKAIAGECQEEVMSSPHSLGD